MKSKLHAESLLRVPLVRQLLEDRNVGLAPRAVDARWYYEGVLPIRLGGFNPLSGAVYYPASSHLARWLDAPAKSARRHNENDWLVQELLFAVHDYLHVWAYGVIDALAPKHGFRERPKTRAALEDRVFCHIVSEAVATVGLDYWFLCTLNLNELCDLGTRFDFGLTTDYHQRFAPEYRRFGPSLRVQHAEFFGVLTRFYCSGVWAGFDLRALKRSPLVLRWLEHELRYSRLQRRYARQWFSELAPRALAFDASELDAPIAVNRAWQHELIAELGALVWDKVKNRKEPGFRHVPRRAWSPDYDRPIDFRFVNLNALRAERRALEVATNPTSELFRAYQTIARTDFAKSGFLASESMLSCVQAGDYAGLAECLAGRRTLDPTDKEPRELLLLT